MRYFKIIYKNGRPIMGNPRFRYDLPKRGKPGGWTRKAKEAKPCVTGYHACVGLIKLYDLLLSNSLAQDLIAADKEVVIVEIESQSEWLNSMYRDKVVTRGPVRIIQKIPVYCVDLALHIENSNPDYWSLDTDKSDKIILGWISRRAKRAAAKKITAKKKTKKAKVRRR